MPSPSVERTAMASPLGAGPASASAERGRTKGGFKSSPLSPLGADESRIVAEDIRKQKAREREVREKDEKEKDESRKAEGTKE